MLRAARNRIEAIARRHLDWYDHNPYTRPRLVRKPPRIRKNEGKPGRGRMNEAGRPMLDFDNAVRIPHLRQSY